MDEFDYDFHLDSTPEPDPVEVELKEVDVKLDAKRVKFNVLKDQINQLAKLG